MNSRSTRGPRTSPLGALGTIVSYSMPPPASNENDNYQRCGGGDGSQRGGGGGGGQSSGGGRHPNQDVPGSNIKPPTERPDTRPKPSDEKPKPPKGGEMERIPGADRD